jgi:aminomethyltransferase
MNQTPLYEEHLALGARMVEFAGWQMPLHYPSGISQEHIAVRTSAGLFDVSHMGQLSILGQRAGEFLSYTTLNDPGKLRSGRGQYSMIPNAQGGLIDDIYLYKNDDEDFLIIANAANKDKVVRHLRRLAERFDTDVVDASESWALLALQGPGSSLMLARLVEDDLGLLKKNHKQVMRMQGCLVDIARTGYTGEDGFEILCRPADAGKLWRGLLAAGVVPCGLGARDTLRLEAGFPLFGHEFNETTNPLCSDYAWVVKDKAFYGREALWNPNCQRKLIGLKLLERGIARQGYRLFRGDKLIGEVTSGSISPFTRESIALGWVDTAFSEAGTEITVEIRNEKAAALISKPPFFENV